MKIEMNWPFTPFSVYVPEPYPSIHNHLTCVLNSKNYVKDCLEPCTCMIFYIFLSSFVYPEQTHLFLTSDRAKKFDVHLTKLSKYVEALPSKKPQQLRNELLTNERSSGATLKISQIHRNSSELGSQKFDDRSKNVGLSKRSRTSATEPRVCKTRIY